eukprot:6667230-Ditylum_brightwellii.AAC.1
MAVLPDGVLSLFDDDAAANQYVDDISKAILSLQCEGEKDMTVLKEQNGAGAHRRHHAALDVQTTTDVQYASEEKKMQEGVDFK